MKTQAALVRANGAVHLNAKPAINMNIAMVVSPGNAKHNHPFRFDDALKDFLAAIFRVLLEHNRQRIENFLDRLMKLRFGRVLRLHLGHQLCYVISHWERSRFAELGLGGRWKYKHNFPVHSRFFCSEVQLQMIGTPNWHSGLAVTINLNG